MGESKDEYRTVSRKSDLIYEEEQSVNRKANMLYKEEQSVNCIIVKEFGSRPASPNGDSQNYQWFSVNSGESPEST
ncbi:hypothetical protein [Xenorhabdus lircayensis]|uniref:Uncharacterized protein n=1 Tax=Xenorhabdus lircayensis TaxID=2763499 RepID=A0ABS0U7R5_9GAMM|nr:hypothetical protein [Xenorhabdus lircayensis]MBI6549932.1 hypothetical protein [Xenorhabdus lircayensis]